MTATNPRASVDGLQALPPALTKRVLLAAGAVTLARAASAKRAWAALQQEEGIWEELCHQIWPAATLTRAVVEDYGGSWREALRDGNRRGAMMAWRPKAEDSAWTWKYNEEDLFYCGRATLLALDEVAKELCVFVHAVTNYPDLRSASRSALHEVKADKWRRGKLRWAREMTPKQPVEVQRDLRDNLEEKTVLRWPASSFREGHVYVFTYACEGQYCGEADYKSVPLVDLSEVSITGRGGGGGGGGDWPAAPAARGTNNLLRPLWHRARQLQAQAQAAGYPALYVERRGHVERPELDGLPRHQVASALLESSTAVPASWQT